MQKKICHITTVHLPYDNRIFYKECISLKNEGYDVSLIVAGEKDHTAEGIKIFGIPKKRSRIKRFFTTSLIHAYKKAISLKCEIYHFHDTELIPMGLMLRLSGKKVIYDIHENNPAALLSRPYLKRKFTRILLSKTIDIIEKFSVRFFSAVITARPDISERFIKRKPFLLRNFPILPDLNNTPELAYDKNKKSVIYVGGMTKIRGIKELITAFENIDDTELWLLGRFASAEFEKECSQLEGWKNVVYFGSVEPFEIFSYIKKADIGIITFLPKPNHLTTLATKPFEYMACGLPLIMSNFVYWKDFFKDSSEYADPKDSDAIGKCISSLINDPDKMKKMSERNSQLALNEYNWQSDAKNLFLCYETVLKRKKK